MSLRDRLTILMPSSPIPSHPSIALISDTIARIRAYPELEDVEIVVMLDGVREEQAHRYEAYEAYKQNLADAAFPNVTLIPFDEHMHQSGMMWSVLPTVKTPLLLFCEHDTYPDGQVPWEAIANAISNDCPVIRLHIFHEVLHVHRALYAKSREWICGVPTVRTTQFSMRPHVALTEWYQRLMADWFTEEDRTMVEDAIIGPVSQLGWDRFRLRIYAPGDDMTRSRTNDGRQTDPKFPMLYRGELK